MSDGVMSLPRVGERIAGGGLDATVKVKTDYPALMSSFEMVIPPHYDVGAHVHEDGEEIFFVLEGELEMFAFEPVDPTLPDWHDWRSTDDEGPMRGGPGTFMFVPEDCPHAFGNPTDEPARMFFQSSVSGGHEHYFEQLAALLREHDGKPPATEASALRERWHIRQLTNISGGRVPAENAGGT